LIYWSTTNLWTWGQQYYVIKRNPTPGSPAFEELQRKRAHKAKLDGKEITAGSDEQNPSGEEGQAGDISGQRLQPKKKKKKKK
jgi:YidC/Oxa1 family membrane protein insertase